MRGSVGPIVAEDIRNLFDKNNKVNGTNFKNKEKKKTN